MLALAEEGGVLAQYHHGDHIYVVCKTAEHRNLVARYAKLAGVATVFGGRGDRAISKPALRQQLVGLQGPAEHCVRGRDLDNLEEQ